MKILIATGIYPPDMGGPAEYAKHLNEEFVRLGHVVTVLAYGPEKRMPAGIRHLYYFFRILRRIFSTDFILALDTMSVGLPAVCAARLFGKKCALRVGGDFLWESYVERTGDLLPWARFYVNHRPFSIKEKLIFFLTKSTLQWAGAVAFNTEWQRVGTIPVYKLNPRKTSVILNFFGQPLPANEPTEKNFIWAARPIRLKNGDMLKKAFAAAKAVDSALILDERTSSHEALMNRLASCYAVILPSVSEMSPNFILDALRFGKPFIVTRETGLYEQLKGVGLFVNPTDSKDITEKILMLADSKNYEVYQKKAATFHFRHSWEEMAREFIALIRIS